MSWIAGGAARAITAASVDLAYDATPDKQALRGFDYAADKLMPESSAESSIAVHNFKIGVADAGAYHLNQRFAVASWQVGVAKEL
jgi:hypothetical protein